VASPIKAVEGWLDRPQRTNRDALVVGLVGAAIFAAALYAARRLLAAADLVDIGTPLPVWLAAAIAGVALGVGLLLGRRTVGVLENQVGALKGQVGRLEARTSELGASEPYSEHIREALRDLRKVVGGELPWFSLRDYVEKGLFEPAQRLLMRDGTRGDVRFSVLHVDGDEFVMAEANDPYPALGHSLDARQNFRLAIAGSFSELAYRHGRVYASRNLAEDDRFRTHPRARPERRYDSIVSVPLATKDTVDGVFNVIAARQDAFNPVDITYITMLGAVIDLARAAQYAIDALRQGPRQSDDPVPGTG
jgi:GAF domain-containing protein